jgi:uncharacterized damage-inducible protein DinB
MDRSAIEQFEHGGEKLKLAIRGLTREDLIAPPAPEGEVGKWSIQQVVLHLADCEAVFADRIKRVIAEENPTLLAFDENKWADALHYDDQSAELGAQQVDVMRRQLGAVLKNLSVDAFNRSGTHSEAGKITLADIVNKANKHFEHHLSFIHKKRAKMGKEMW